MIDRVDFFDCMKLFEEENHCVKTWRTSFEIPCAESLDQADQVPERSGENETLQDRVGEAEIAAVNKSSRKDLGRLEGTLNASENLGE